MKKKKKIVPRGTIEKFAPYLSLKDTDEIGEYVWSGVFSSNIRWYKYYSKLKRLHVAFKNGSEYLYRNVPWATWNELQLAGIEGQGTIKSGVDAGGSGSVGVRFWDLIRNPSRVSPSLRKQRGLPPLPGPFRHAKRLYPYERIK